MTLVINMMARQNVSSMQNLITHIFSHDRNSAIFRH